MLFFQSRSAAQPSAITSENSTLGKTDKSDTCKEKSTGLTKFGQHMSSLPLPPISGLPETRTLFVQEALNQLFTKSHFDICLLREILEIVGKPRGPAYALLSTMHCVNYSAMRPEVREAIPRLINELLCPPIIECTGTVIALHGVSRSNL